MSLDKDKYAPSRELFVDVETKEKLRNLAWSKRESLSAIVREIFEDYVAGKHDKVKDAEMPVGESRARLGLRVEDDLWEAAGERAWRTHTTRSQVLRNVAVKLTKNIPLEREAVTR